MRRRRNATEVAASLGEAGGTRGESCRSSRPTGDRGLMPLTPSAGPATPGAFTRDSAHDGNSFGSKATAPSRFRVASSLDWRGFRPDVFRRRPETPRISGSGSRRCARRHREAARRYSTRRSSNGNPTAERGDARRSIASGRPKRFAAPLEKRQSPPDYRVVTQNNSLSIRGGDTHMSF